VGECYSTNGSAWPDRNGLQNETWLVQAGGCASRFTVHAFKMQISTCLQMPRTVTWLLQRCFCKSAICISLLIYIDTPGAPIDNANEPVTSRLRDMHPIVDTQYLFDIGYEPTPELPGSLQLCETSMCS
jgi:hypothetical protein